MFEVISELVIVVVFLWLFGWVGRDVPRRRGFAVIVKDKTEQVVE